MGGIYQYVHLLGGSTNSTLVDALYTPSRPFPAGHSRDTPSLPFGPLLPSPPGDSSYRGGTGREAGGLCMDTSTGGI